MNYMEAAFAPAEERYRWDVYAETWGHLAPNPRRTYRGTILFATTAYGNLSTVLIDADFADLDDSPWFYEHLCDYIESVATEDGKVYRFTGTYRLTKKHGPVFTGSVAEVSR